MKMRWFTPIILFAIYSPTYGGMMNSFQDGSKFIRDSIEYALRDAYGGLGFGLDFLKQAIEELSDQSPSDKEEYDFIVVGAGSSGATVAARLSEIEDFQVLLIEAGDHEYLVFDVPLASLAILDDPFIDWHYKSEPSNDFCLGYEHNQCKLRKGKMMGGSSGMNLMIACRGTKSDYDEWGEATGDPGWSYDGMLKYFKKLERYNLSEVEADPSYRGTDGPVDIINPPYRTPLVHAFLEAGKELGFPSRDYNGKLLTGFNYVQTNQRHGERLSTNKAYLYPTKDRKNLVVSMQSRVGRIIIDPDTKTAKGVEFTKSERTIQVFARKEVILSAGAIASPQILMLSGIGPADHLREMDIDVLVDLPVGENMMDHVGYAGLVFLINETLGIDMADFSNPTNPTLSEYLTERKGPMTMPGGVEGLAYVNIDNLDPDDEKPNAELMFASLSVLSAKLAHSAFGIPDHWFNKLWADHLYHHAWTIWPLLMKPKSRGKMFLRSTDPNDLPKIYPYYFEDPDDARVVIKAIRMAIKISQTQAMRKFESKLFDRPIPGCQGHEPDSDNYWNCALKTFTLSVWHQSGTAKMGKESDPTAVVNPNLQVKGIKKLRVIDASIMPDIVAAHTNIPSIAIAEKGADLLKADHGYI